MLNLNLKFKHHQLALEKAIERVKRIDKRVKAIILGGSIAHGFATENSDVDLMFVISEDDYKAALITGDLHYYDDESADYENGYVESKYFSLSFIRDVIEKGSEPARFAFKDAIVIESEYPELDELIKAAATYPVKDKDKKIEQFLAQMEGWQWMYNEGIKKNDIYVINHSVTNICLFAGRLILAHNETIYPYHKWFLKVLETTTNKPTDIVDKIKVAITTKTPNDVNAVIDCIKAFRTWKGCKYGWPARFIMDSELAWQTKSAAIADL